MIAKGEFFEAIIKTVCCLYQNELGIMWTRRDEAEKAQSFLETAEFIYHRYMKEVFLTYFHAI